MDRMERIEGMGDTALPHTVNHLHHVETKVSLMNINDLTHDIIGCAMQVHTILGCGLQEVIYQKALSIEMLINT